MPLLVVIGYGPGNGHAIAQRFGREGWTIALIGRNDDRLNDGVELLATEGTTAHAFVSDASDPAALQSTIANIRDELGPITSIALSAFRPVAVGDVLTADLQDVAHVFDISVTGLLAAVQAALDDLRAADGASVLVVNGALGLHDDNIDAYATSFGGDGVALECSAKTKLVGLLAARLRPDGVYVGEIVINGSVTRAGEGIDPANIADRIWKMTQSRTETHVHIAHTDN
ncbi:MAG: SDR family NAD(P)-dependent oxidoreductase [Micrococcales bacterium]|nr:SDR family NAD(P)-dependent oxidoreductase [Micrococcales bacterium]